MLADISIALSNLKMTKNCRDKTMSLTSDDSFSRYTKFIPTISPNTFTWSFSLITLFFHDLPLELQEAVRSECYILPDISQLSTFLQEQALKQLWEYTVTTFKLLTEEKHRIRRIMTVFTNGRGSSQYLLVDSHQDTDLNHSGSNVEKT